MGPTHRFRRFRQRGKAWFHSGPHDQANSNLNTGQTISHVQPPHHNPKSPLQEISDIHPVHDVPRVQLSDGSSIPLFQDTHNVSYAPQHAYYHASPQLQESNQRNTTQAVPPRPQYYHPNGDGFGAHPYYPGVAQPALDRGYQPHGGPFNPTIPAGLYSPLPLNYIRLLQLQPGQWSDPIRCSLVIVNFDAASPTPSYEAVSYTWGNASVQKKVICNDQSMQVTRSLFDALQVFREPHADRMLWVDALCINQGDVIERNSQVQLMNRIYSGASSVAVWLGHDRPDTIRMALNMLCLSAKEHWKTHEEFDPASGSLVVQSPQYYVRQYASLYPKVELPTLLDIEGRGLRDLEVLFGCSWFCRLWVIQELVLSAHATFYWGLSSIDCNLVGAAVSQLQEGHHEEISRLKTFNELTRFCHMWNWWRGQWPSDFFEALRLARSSASTDPRDKIYGMLSIPTGDARSDGTPFLEADYRWTTAEVFIAVAAKILLEQQNLDLLSMVQHKDRIPAKLQSWVPDWSNTHGPAPLCDPKRRTSAGEKAVIVVPPFPNVDNVVYRGATSIRGLLLQEVKLVNDQTFDPESDLVDGTFPATLQHLFSSHLYNGKYDDRVLASTYTAGFTEHGLLDSKGLTGMATASHTADYRCFMDCETSNFTIDASSRLQIPSTTSSRNLKRAFRFYSIACRYVIRRRLFIMNDDTLGLGPLAMRPGDIVVILFGGGA